MSEEEATREDSERQARFINLLCTIRLKRQLTQEEVRSQIKTAPNAWQRIALELFHARQRDTAESEERFWDAYYHLAGDYAELENWRAIVSEATPQDIVPLPDLQDNTPSTSQQSAHRCNYDEQERIFGEQEKDFIRVLRKIHARILTTMEAVVREMPDIPPVGHNIAQELLEANEENCEVDFWTVYDVLSERYPALDAYRDAIAQPLDVYRDSFAPLSPKELEKPPSVLLSEVEERPLQWLWQGRIPLGKLTLLDGDAGMGKSLLLYDLIARVTRGAVMPDGTPGLEKPAGAVLIAAAADPITDAGCLLRAGADLGRILAGNCMRRQKLSVSKGECPYHERTFTLPDDLPYLAQYIDEMSAKLVIIDPVISAFGKRSVHSDNAVYGVLLPLLHLIHTKQVACVLTRPLDPKPYQNPLHRGYGAVAFAAIAKAAMLLEKDPDNNEHLLLTSTKNGFGKLAPTLSLCIADENSSPHVYWHGEYKKPSSSPARSQIRRLLEEQAPEMLTAPEIASQLPEVPLSTIRVRLRQMAEEGQIAQPVRGKYCSKSVSQSPMGTIPL